MNLISKGSYEFIKVLAGLWCVLSVELDGDLSLIGQKRDIRHQYDSIQNSPLSNPAKSIYASFTLVSTLVYHGGFQHDGRHPVA